MIKKTPHKPLGLRPPWRWSGGLVVILLVLPLFACGEKTPEKIAPSSGYFTFLDLGKDTLYSDAVRQLLSAELGADSIATRTVVDLDVNYPTFLAQHFEELHRLNQQLNDAKGARVEHDTVKLMYRYIQKKERPFKYVELMFSGIDGRPLYFKIHAGKEGGEILKTMQTKHGPAQTITWREGVGTTHFWEKDDEVLLISQMLDRFGEPEFHIMIYFVGNIETLIETEKARIQQREELRRQSGQKAF